MEPTPSNEVELESDAVATTSKTAQHDLRHEPELMPVNSGVHEAGSSPQPSADDAGPLPANSFAPTTGVSTTLIAQVGGAGGSPLGTAPGATPATSGEARPVEVQGVRTSSERAPHARAPAEVRPGPDTAQLERAQEILRQIRLHLAPGVRRLTLDLEPGELGRVAIQLTSRQGKVSAIVRAERRETLELLRLGDENLRAILAERGIETDSIRLELGFGGQRSPADPRARPATPSTTMHEPESALAPASLHRPSTSLVDTYA